MFFFLLVFLNLLWLTIFISILYPYLGFSIVLIAWLILTWVATLLEDILCGGMNAMWGRCWEGRQSQSQWNRADVEARETAFFLLSVSLSPQYFSFFCSLFWTRGPHCCCWVLLVRVCARACLPAFSVRCCCRAIIVCFRSALLLLLLLRSPSSSPFCWFSFSMATEFVSPEGLRLDGRRPPEMRHLHAVVGVVPSADGSALFHMGNTQVMAVVYGPHEVHNKAHQLHDKALVSSRSYPPPPLHHLRHFPSSPSITSRLRLASAHSILHAALGFCINFTTILLPLTALFGSIIFIIIIGTVWVQHGSFQYRRAKTARQDG